MEGFIYGFRVLHYLPSPETRPIKNTFLLEFIRQDLFKLRHNRQSDTCLLPFAKLTGLRWLGHLILQSRLRIATRIIQWFWGFFRSARSGISAWSCQMNGFLSVKKRKKEKLSTGVWQFPLLTNVQNWQGWSCGTKSPCLREWRRIADTSLCD